ncbi:MAG: toxin [Bacteroidota bacterium]
MNILWDDDKSTKLGAERGISFEGIAVLILEKKYLDVVKHPKRAAQWMFVIPINGYVHVVPFIVDTDGNVILKTAFPSRKFHKRFGEKKP